MSETKLTPQNSQLASRPKTIKRYLTDGMESAVHISYQVTIVANLMAFGNSTTNFKQYGLNIREWRVLALLGQLGQPMTASQIVDEIAQDKANISRAIALLAKKELVVKLPNPKHKVSHVIWLSKKGMQLFQKILPEFTRQAELLTSSLSAQEARTLCKLLDKVKTQCEYVHRTEGF